MVMRCSGSDVSGYLWTRACATRNCRLPAGGRQHRAACMAGCRFPGKEVSISLQILLCIAVVIVTAKLAATAASRLGLPLVLGELLAGVLLGPSLLNIWGLHWLAPAPATSSVADLF